LLLCLCRIIENSAPLELIWEEFGDGTPLFCEEEWQSIKAIATFLDNFDTLTNLVQGDFVLASEALLVVKKFKNLPNITDVEHKMVKSLKAGIKSHMDSNRAKLSRILSYLRTDNVAAYCACVDPRACDLTFFSQEERKVLKTNFVSYAVNCIKKWKQRQSSLRSQKLDDDVEFISKRLKTPPSGISSSDPSKFQRTIFEALEHTSEAATDEDTEETDKDMQLELSLRAQITDEFSKFRKAAPREFLEMLVQKNVQSKLENTQCVFKRRRKTANAHTYPNFQIVAASLFSVRISSAASERLFSLAGLIRTARRNKMSAKLFDALICYSYNDLMLQRQREQSQQRRTRRRNLVA